MVGSPILQCSNQTRQTEIRTKPPTMRIAWRGLMGLASGAGLDDHGNMYAQLAFSAFCGLDLAT